MVGLMALDRVMAARQWAQLGDAALMMLLAVALCALAAWLLAR